MRRLSQWLSNRWGQRDSSQSPAEGELPELDRKDIVAVIIALFQLFAPLVLGVLAVAVIVSLILLNIK